MQTLYTAGHKVELVVGFSDLSDLLNTVAVRDRAGIAVMLRGHLPLGAQATKLGPGFPGFQAHPLVAIGALS